MLKAASKLPLDVMKPLPVKFFSYCCFEYHAMVRFSPCSKETLGFHPTSSSSLCCLGGVFVGHLWATDKIRCLICGLLLP